VKPRALPNFRGVMMLYALTFWAPILLAACLIARIVEWCSP